MCVQDCIGEVGGQIGLQHKNRTFGVGLNLEGLPVRMLVSDEKSLYQQSPIIKAVDMYLLKFTN